MAQNCYKCHDGAHRKGGLQLDEKQKALAGGDDGPILTAGDPDKSKLIHFVRGDDPKEVMPPKGKGERLKPEQVDVLVRWVEQGAVWRDGAVATTAKPPAASHWAFKLPVRPEPPAVKQKAWVRNPIDDFILARLEKEGLTPSPEADRHALIRRVSLDLTGLPPTPAGGGGVRRRTSRPTPTRRLVDRLLAVARTTASAGRAMWLDLARYADSDGYGDDPLRHDLALPRLGHQRLQPQHALRPVHHRAARRRPAARTRRRTS